MCYFLYKFNNKALYFLCQQPYLFDRILLCRLCGYCVLIHEHLICLVLSVLASLHLPLRRCGGRLDTEQCLTMWSWSFVIMLVSKKKCRKLWTKSFGYNLYQKEMKIDIVKEWKLTLFRKIIMNFKVTCVFGCLRSIIIIYRAISFS